MGARKQLGRDEKGRFVKAGTAGPRSRARKRYGGWTADKEAIFFRELATVCNVSSALRACGLSRRSSEAYDRRREDASFRFRWEAAIDEGYALLELEMLERARFGDNRPPPGNEVERRLRQVPTSLGLQLLKLYHARKAKAAPAAGAAASPPRTLKRAEAARIRREFDARLSDYNRRMGGEG